MKKLLITLLTVILCLGLVACGTPETTTADTTADTTATTDAPEAPETASSNITPEVEDGTVGAHHWNGFAAALAENPAMTAEELANALLHLEVDGAPLNQFMGGAMLWEDTEYFPGFDNFQITGYKEAAIFMPMMGSIAYVGYVFELEEDADVAAFVDTLNANCNPRWQICVTADQTVVGSVGNKVMFLMCPATYEMPEEAFGDEFFGDDLYFEDELEMPAFDGEIAE